MEIHPSGGHQTTVNPLLALRVLARLMGVTPEQVIAEVQRQCPDGDASLFEPPETWLRRGAMTLVEAWKEDGLAGMRLVFDRLSADNLPDPLDRLKADCRQRGSG